MQYTKYQKTMPSTFSPLKFFPCLKCDTGCGLLSGRECCEITVRCLAKVTFQYFHI